MKRLLAIFFATVALAPVSHAVTYVQPKPLKETVTVPVGNVKAGPVELPIISWGADIAVIYGNGNSKNSTAQSLFGQAKLDFRLVREDVFSQQLERYLRGQTPYLRGTMGMISMASDALAADPRTKPVVIYKLSDSAGGDALVVKDRIKTVADLKGKTIVLQAYGPHVDYLTRILTDAGLNVADVNIKWVRDLTGTDETPAAAFRQKDVDAAFVITPDALALSSNGTVGTGAEDSVRGARILLSTKTANRVIVDVYAVRADYLQQHRSEVEAFVRTLIKAQEELAQLVQDRGTRKKEYQDAFRSAAKLLLDSDVAVADAEGMYGDAQHALFNGNVAYFAKANEPRRFEILAAESLAGIKALGMASGRNSVSAEKWQYDLLRANLGTVRESSGQRFNEGAAAAVVARKQQQGALAEGELYSFEVYFAPNQNAFSADLYADAFNKVIALASTYGGALITVEGHSDPMGYLKQKKANAATLVLGQVKQSARNLSLSRAQAVRDSIIGFAGSKAVSLDPSQFVLVGHGIAMPKTGVCGDDPCAPKTEQEWRSNMRVVFRIIQVEAESSVFNPL